MTTFYLTTFVEEASLAEFQQTNNPLLLKQMPLTTGENADFIAAELKKQGKILVGLETEEFLSQKLALVLNFKNQVAAARQQQAQQEAQNKEAQTQ